MGILVMVKSFTTKQKETLSVPNLKLKILLDVDIT
jgi:hypothetical protein